MPTFFQESGRGSRQRGRRSTTHLFIDLASYVNLKRQNNGEDLSEDDDLRAEDAEALALVGYNSALTPLKEIKTKGRAREKGQAEIKVRLIFAMEAPSS